MIVFKKIRKDTTLKTLITRYDGLRANFNNSNDDYETFEKTAIELKEAFVKVHDFYSDRYRHLIDGYIFNINDFIIRNHRLLGKNSSTKSEDEKRQTKDVLLNNSATIVFANGQLPNTKNNDEE